MEQINNWQSTWAVAPLFRALRAVCDEIGKSEPGHGALLIRVGQRLISHPAALLLVGEPEWYSLIRRFSLLAIQVQTPATSEDDEAVERLTADALRGYKLDAIEAAKVLDPSRRQPVPTFVINFQKE